jgi:hypothetical protein
MTGRRASSSPRRVTPQQRLLAAITGALAISGVAAAAALGLSLPWLATGAVITLSAASALSLAIMTPKPRERVVALTLLNAFALAGICAIGAYAWARPTTTSPMGRFTNPRPGAVTRWGHFQGTFAHLANDAELWLVENSGDGFDALAPVDRYPDGKWIAEKKLLTDSGPSKGAPVQVALAWTDDAATERRLYDSWSNGISPLSIDLQRRILARAAFWRARSRR